jgi:hypothetical protein
MQTTTINPAGQDGKISLGIDEKTRKTIYDLYLDWTEQERKQALVSMPEFRRVELSSALRSAGCSASELRSAGCSASELRSAGYSLSALHEKTYEEDIKAKAKLMGIDESSFVIDTIARGLMNGREYGTVKSCGCLLGTAAKKAGQSVEAYCAARKIVKDSDSPAERWFLAVSIGDTPENNDAAKMGVKWISEAIAEMRGASEVPK